MTSYHAYKVGFPELGYLKLTQISRMRYVIPMPGPMSEHQFFYFILLLYIILSTCGLSL